uniref:Protein kinase domain-containing protein n=2 Tax=Rhizophagus irregularis TaxID=588596 RepID=U9TVW4_RHIID
MDDINNKDEIVTENNLNNLNDELNNLNNLNEEDGELGIYEQQIFDQEFGLCTECNQPNTFEDWCKECYSKKFQQNFNNWTSGNMHIDKFIQEAQLNARNVYESLEWIPYNRLKNIVFLAQGGFSKIYKAIWLDGLIDKWDYEKQEWEREFEDLNEQDYEDAINPKIKNPLKNDEIHGQYVVLKSLNDSSKIDEDFLNEWKLHLQCQHEVRSNGSVLVPLNGITQDPDTLNYIIVMSKLPYAQLEGIHKLNLIHGDLHNGNILCFDHEVTVISDLGLCRPVNQPNRKNDVYGVLPYVAPEVLRGKSYTKASDIYSFGIIMWEMTSGVSAFYNIPHNLELSLEICKGKRPEILEGTIPEYVEIMKRCWDNDPKKRPTAEELKWFFLERIENYPFEEDEEERIPVPENEPEIKYHPKSYYTSRKINYSTKINEILQSENLHHIVEEEAIQEFSDNELVL